MGVTKGVGGNPGTYGTRLVAGLLVGPAIGLVGAVARANVTVRPSPFHPFVDSLSARNS